MRKQMLLYPEDMLVREIAKIAFLGDGRIRTERTKRYQKRH